MLNHIKSETAFGSCAVAESQRDSLSGSFKSLDYSVTHQYYSVNREEENGKANPSTSIDSSY
jgi:hypothetical protein